MVVWAKVCDLTEDLLWFVCGLYVEILTSSLKWRHFYLKLPKYILKGIDKRLALKKYLQNYF